MNNGLTQKSHSKDNLIIMKTKGFVKKIHSLQQIETMLRKTTAIPDVWKIEDIIYHSCSALSRSSLVKYLDSPANFLIEQKDNKHLTFGRAFHHRLLDGEEYYKKHYITKPKSIKKRAGKVWDAFVEENKDKTILTIGEDEDIGIMVERLFEDLSVEPYLSDESAQPEVAVFLREEDIWTKAKFDLWIPGECLVEFKTTAAKNQDQFIKQFFDYGYDIQAAFYLDRFRLATDMEVDFFCVVAVEKAPPYKIYKFAINQKVLEIGRKRYKQLLETHSICTYENYWPYSTPGFDDIRAPDWIASKYL